MRMRDVVAVARPPLATAVTVTRRRSPSQARRTRSEERVAPRIEEQCSLPQAFQRYRSGPFADRTRAARRCPTIGRPTIRTWTAAFAPWTRVDCAAIVHVWVAGVGSMLPVESIASTRKVCDPTAKSE